MNLDNKIYQDIGYDVKVTQIKLYNYYEIFAPKTYNTLQQELHLMQQIRNIFNQQNCAIAYNSVMLRAKSLSQYLCEKVCALYAYCKEQIYPIVQQWAIIGVEKYEDLCLKYLKVKPIYVTAGITSFIIFCLFCRNRSRGAHKFGQKSKGSGQMDDFIFDEEQGSTAANNVKSDESLFSLKKPMDAILQASNEEEEDEEIKQDRLFFEVFQNYRETLGIDLNGSKHYLR